jgi:hypothetical protein
VNNQAHEQRQLPRHPDRHCGDRLDDAAVGLMPAIFFPSLPLASETVTGTSLLPPSATGAVSHPDPQPFDDAIERITSAVATQSSGLTAERERPAS